MSLLQLLDRAQTHQVLQTLIPLAQRIRVEVAWARDSSDIAALLLAHRHRVERLVLGQSFGATSQTLLHAWQDHPGFWVVPNRAHGVYHPKVYRLDGPGWRVLIVGSANLTHAGLNPGLRGNVEAGLMLVQGVLPSALHATLHPPIGLLQAQETAVSDSVFAQLDGLLESPHVQAYRPSQAYVLACQRVDDLPPTWRSLATLGLTALLKGQAPQTPLADLRGCDWDGFVTGLMERVLSQPKAWTDRMRVLETARAFWDQSPQPLLSLSAPERLALTGIHRHMPGQPGVDWWLFGRIVPVRIPLYHDLAHPGITPALRQLSHALLQIPRQGEVSALHHAAFWRGYQQAGGRSLGLATRLLMLRRPDVFVALTQANVAGLGRLLGWSRRPKTAAAHWTEAVVRVQGWQNAWAAPGADDPPGLAQIWAGRAALLDMMCWAPQPPRAVSSTRG